MTAPTQVKAQVAQIKVTQVKSLITIPEARRRIVKGLGLTKIGSTRTHKDNNCIRGMINKVKDLVSFELISNK